MLVLVITALVAVYIVLGMLYESYMHPITIWARNSTFAPSTMNSSAAVHFRWTFSISALEWIDKQKSISAPSRTSNDSAGAIAR